MLWKQSIKQCLGTMSWWLIRLQSDISKFIGGCKEYNTCGKAWRKYIKFTYAYIENYEMAGWHHWLDGHESEWTPVIGDGQGGLACCDSWGHKESDTTEQLNWTDAWSNMVILLSYFWSYFNVVSKKYSFVCLFVFKMTHSLHHQAYSHSLWAPSRCRCHYLWKPVYVPWTSFFTGKTIASVSLFYINAYCACLSDFSTAITPTINLYSMKEMF